MFNLFAITVDETELQTLLDAVKDIPTVKIFDELIMCKSEFASLVEERVSEIVIDGDLQDYILNVSIADYLIESYYDGSMDETLQHGSITISTQDICNIVSDWYHEDPDAFEQELYNSKDIYSRLVEYTVAAVRQILTEDTNGLVAYLRKYYT